jgi:hypothetical protein
VELSDNGTKNWLSGESFARDAPRDVSSRHSLNELEVYCILNSIDSLHILFGTHQIFDELETF